MKSLTKHADYEWVDRYSPKQIHDMLYGKLLTPDERTANNAVAEAVRSGQVSLEDLIGDDEDEYYGSIPPSWRTNVAKAKTEAL